MTAVQWLIKQITKEKGLTESYDIFQQALIMEKEHSLPTADDNTYMQIINYGLQWGGKNPLGWKTGQDVVDYAKSKHKLFKGDYCAVCGCREFWNDEEE